MEQRSSSLSDEPARRSGDRRQQAVTVPTDRRRGERRDTPGFDGLLKTLLRR
jgi:hypothetical protein